MRDKSINTALLTGISDPTERTRTSEMYMGSKVILDKTLRGLLERKLAKSLETIEDPAIYTNPNLVAAYADQSGYRRALREIIDLLP